MFVKGPISLDMIVGLSSVKNYSAIWLRARIDSSFKIVGPKLTELLQKRAFLNQILLFAIVASTEVEKRWGFHQRD